MSFPVYRSINAMTVKHNIPPVFDENSRILILGSFPSVQSRENAFFYAHPRNRFWTVLAAVFGEPTPFTTDEKKRFLLRRNIALWDVIARCEVTGSSDASIRNAEPNQIETILRHAEIERIIVNGKTAYKYYQKYLYPSTGIEAVCLPSTSPANARMKERELIDIWRDAVIL